MPEFRVPDPYDFVPELPALTVTSEDFTDGGTLATPQLSGRMGVPGGGDVSPQLSWSGAPEGTQSYVVTVFDPDAPTVSGFWHLSIANLPASVTSLPAGAVTADDFSGLPDEAVVLRNDAGYRGFVGAAPPENHGPHRYIVAVHAVDTTELPVDETSSCAFIGFNLFSEAIARGTLTGIHEA